MGARAIIIANPKARNAPRRLNGIGNDVANIAVAANNASVQPTLFFLKKFLTESITILSSSP
jgi:hypothetical protein